MEVKHLSQISFGFVVYLLLLRAQLMMTQAVLLGHAFWGSPVLMWVFLFSLIAIGVARSVGLLKL